METVPNKEIKRHPNIKSHCDQIKVDNFLKMKSRIICMIMLLPKVRPYA